MAAGRYAEAARATLTKIELFASHSYASRRVLFDLQIANENLDWLYGSVVINGIHTVPLRLGCDAWNAVSAGTLGRRTSL